MPKPTKNAGLYCTLLSILAVIGIIAGFVTMSAIALIIFLIPTVAYEIYRTEGKSTKWASLGMLIILILEIVLILFSVSFSISEFLQRGTEYVNGYSIPLGDIKLIGPAVIIILSLTLLKKTRGIYTKWLAITIIVSSLALTYLLDPETFTSFARIGVNKILQLI